MTPPLIDRSIAPRTLPEYQPTVPAMLDALAGRLPDHPCVATPQDHLTYAELTRQSELLAAQLILLGVGKASRVAILFPNSVQWVVAWAAAARLGAVTIPVNTFYTTPELLRFLRHADVQFLLTVDRFLQHDYAAELQAELPELTGEGGVAPLHLLRLPQLRRVVVWGDSAPGWADHIEATATTAAGVAPLVGAMEADVSPDDDLLVTYTSGSTGEPKGVIHAHGGVIRHARNLAAMSDVDEQSKIWTPMPLCWVGGFVFTLLRALTVGACFVTQELFEPGAALRLMEQERVTHVSAWPALSKTLRDHPEFPDRDLTSIRAGSFYDAMPVDARPADRTLVVTSLGMSETCGPHTFWTAEEERTGAPPAYRGNFGHEVPGVQHRIVDPDSGEDVPEGDEGEVLVRGYSVMKGLYKRERSEVFDAEGWLHTGDRGYFRDGWFFFTGRQSDLVKTRGSNVSPPEVEAALLAVDGIRAAYVLGVPHDDDGEQVVAVVVADEGEVVDLSDVRSSVKRQLSSYKVPRHLLLFEASDIPWLVSQKVDKRALLEIVKERL